MLEKVLSWIESGKQVGVKFSHTKNGLIYWDSIGIEKYNGRYLLYVDSILEVNMIDEKYDKEECFLLDNIEEVIKNISIKTSIALEDLKPCKGQKIFNPKFYLT